MSHTFYESPDGAEPALSIDVTHDFCWFFEEDGTGLGYARVRKSELRAIWQALGQYLYDIDCPLCGTLTGEHTGGCLFAETALVKLLGPDGPPPA